MAVNGLEVEVVHPLLLVVAVIPSMKRSHTALAAIKPRVSSVNPTPYSWVNESTQSFKGESRHTKQY